MYNLLAVFATAMSILSPIVSPSKILQQEPCLHYPGGNTFRYTGLGYDPKTEACNPPGCGARYVPSLKHNGKYYTWSQYGYYQGDNLMSQHCPFSEHFQGNSTCSSDDVNAVGKYYEIFGGDFHDTNSNSSTFYNSLNRLVSTNCSSLGTFPNNCGELTRQERGSCSTKKLHYFKYVYPHYFQSRSCSLFRQRRNIFLKRCYAIYIRNLPAP